jgi:cobalt-zinc-cadmium efflux system outer membrane protein
VISHSNQEVFMRIISIVLLGMVSGLLAAQEPSLSVEEAVQLAIQNNPRLSAARREITAGRFNVRSAGALANPEILFAPAITEGGSDSEGLIFQPLEMNGSRSARTAAARARLRAAEAGAVVELRNLVFETKTAYYELLQAQTLRTLARDLLQVAEEFERITRRQVEVGTRPGIDQTQIEIEVTRARQQLTIAEATYTTALAALNTLMGRAPTEPVGSLPPLAIQPETINRTAALQQALTARSEIEVERALQDSLVHEARVARASGRPDMGLQWRGESLTRSPRSGGFGVVLSLPLVDYGSRRNQIQSLEESARTQSDRVEIVRHQIRQEVEQALARLRAAEAVLKTYEEGLLGKAERLLDSSRVGFQAGQTSVIAVIEAQRTYRFVQTEYINAQVNSAQARAEFEHATGAVPASLLTLPQGEKQ